MKKTKNVDSFPSIKKNIKWFLMDESWKITKKDALKLASWAIAISLWIDNSNALNTRCIIIPHSNSCGCNWSC
ncbi:MAG: hypothetical protein ACD_4C00102G0002 [uncultured bacterium (gcode 4)]|uniref:Uncharacterized protein n=1 Tax=uncultured bacterium (gcode 4) TaxID=1234023 RepID=K2FVH1_9BACT|nr:MAG: hypothetical protein ACD_4C00102G0002 [uncultured bacterium (gcode 4)]